MDGSFNAPVIAGLTDNVPSAAKGITISISVNINVKPGPGLLDVVAKTGGLSTHEVVANDLEALEKAIASPLVPGRVAEDLVAAVNLVGGRLVLANGKPNLEQPTKKPKKKSDAVTVEHKPDGIHVTATAHVGMSVSAMAHASTAVQLDETAAVDALARLIRSGRKSGNVAKALKRFEEACNSYVQADRIQALGSCLAIAGSALKGKELTGSQLDTVVAAEGGIAPGLGKDIRLICNRMKHFDTPEQEQATAALFAAFASHPKTWIDAAFQASRTLLLKAMV